jgi:hypothetical protein
MSDDENEFVMEAEFGAHLRTSIGNITMNTFKNTKFKNKNPLEQFYTLVDAGFEKMKEEEIPFISYDTKDDIIDSISKLDKPYYKNPIAFILGYYASNYGKNITNESIQQVFDYLQRVNEIPEDIFKISKHDIVRYARLWTKLK